MAVFVIGGELGLFLAFKLVRGDFFWFGTERSFMNFVGSFVQRIALKNLVDYTGCIHFRHPLEFGGLAFSLNTIWAQIFPFVALVLYDGEREITTTLVISLCSWILLNIVLFCTIDMSYLNTFFSTKTKAQYACELFRNSDEHSAKFKAAFITGGGTKGIEVEVKEWVSANIQQWTEEGPDWFTVELIPDDMLPAEVFHAEGGIERIRSNNVFSVRKKSGRRQVQPEEQQ